MNVMSIPNRFEKESSRRVRFGITRGQALLFLITFSLFFYLLTELVFASSHTEPLKGTEVTVRDGDSLWTIAVRHQTETVDVRDLIQDIKEANDLQSNLIYPGQTLLIPDPK
ncbi:MULTISPECIES: cell division suppressor protein YneA [Brevibacillus]|uniref:LysM domain-containing protein n=1 Tax=Brevibacillus parabrevis TaxID=54914 RepID=A0A4Y3PKA8_BREPA|nr:MULTISPECIES: LysM peptidoglycan-binding domain-containing protein [Brevibacillus]MBU8711266.1 LysM peptidoglycan-binding domain-containing protein [Brevibacillus parabrevis]MDH6350118.1 nucleoid-associated protein YgaU [Brevibacillus sp. 1238]MDR4999560.1 LysM peptidoglycan-binding domain-containing protein [Brevibacillus parabrevis]RNB94477.1 LysM peptidoglycan-binding domain-containing protein [Brevibacillus parabrevis]WDV93101.1 LysM peptidoglycan-binding domain-containing protein [Brev